MNKTMKIITSALPYVNNQPHLGNIIGSVLSADIYSRFCKKNGEEAVFLCGTDEYGTAIEMAAFAQNKLPIEICEEYREIHKKIYNWFNIKFDKFGHTTTPAHTENVQHFFKKIYENGHFKEEDIEQFFCDTCSIFLADRYVTGTCKYCNYGDAKGDQCDGCGHTYKALDLINAKCTLCSSAPSIKVTRHLFFDLGKFTDQLQALYDQNGQYWSENGKNITKSWLTQELLPRCMTRDLKNLWGVPVPLEGFEKKVFYVWFDAVIGYYTFLKELVNSEEYEMNDEEKINEKINTLKINDEKINDEKINDEKTNDEKINEKIKRACDEEEPKKDNYRKWLKDSELIQFMGKDNVFFHTIVFPSLIYATGESYPVLKRLSATEYLLFENEKFSKSRGHGIFGLDLIDNSLGTSCLWRYYLTKIRPEKNDSNFSFTHFINSVDADLNNNIGNFCNRVLKYIKNKSNKQINISELKEADIKMCEHVNKVYTQYLQCFSQIKLRDALDKVLEISKIGNEFVQSVVSNKTDMGHGFQVAFSIVGLIGQLLEPFVPVSSMKLLKMCNLESENFRPEFEITKKWEISEDIYPLFNKLDDAILEKLNSFKK